MEKHGIEDTENCGNKNSDTNNNHADDGLFLTPYIEANDIAAARRLSRVTQLPNGGENANIELFTGYLTVDSRYNANYFFWFFPAQNDVTQDAPLILWLQGGPLSSCAVGIFNQHGPICIDPETTKLGVREHTALTRHAAMLYVDNPIGAGFSFADNPKAWHTCLADTTAHLHEMLRQFFALFPEYGSRPFWIFGESYGSKFAIAIAYRLYCDARDSKDIEPKQSNSAIRMPDLDLRGLLIGSGVYDFPNMLDFGTYLRQISLIDDQQAEHFRVEQQAIIGALNRDDRQTAAIKFFDLIFGPDSYFKHVTGLPNIHDHTGLSVTNDSARIERYLAPLEVRRAIHANVERRFARDRAPAFMTMATDMLQPVAAEFAALLDANFRVLLWNGNRDVICAPVLTENFLQNHLNCKSAQKYREARRRFYMIGDCADDDDDDDTVEDNVEKKRSFRRRMPDGYVRVADNMTHVIIRNATHVCSFDKPEAVFDLITRTIAGKDLLTRNVE